MSTKTCPNCSHENSEKARFCAKCGHSLAVEASIPAQPPAAPAGIEEQTFNCPRCGVPLKQGTKFCPSCGLHLSQALPQEPMPAPAPKGKKGSAMATQLLSSAQGGMHLAVKWMGGSSEKYEITKDAVRVGRAPDNDIVINHPAVSGHHLSLSITPAGTAITDLNSTNGTQVNGQLITPGQAQTMHVGDVIRIGDLTGNWVSLVWVDEAGEAIRTMSLGKLDLTNVTSALIGRDPAAYLPLNHPTVSFRHAMIEKQASRLVVRDLNSTNGTFINGKRIQQAPLTSGDVIQIGPFKLVYDAMRQSLAQSMGMGHRMDTLKLGREVANKKMILQNVNMTIQPGEFVALVGGSGAGKSTLMKALNGFEPANHGQVLLDGEAFYPKLDLYRTQMGYVPQDDIIHRELPVRLALWYAAKLRLPDAKPKEIQERITNALKAVDMTEHAEKRVRVLSGGQRKRVSIAVELLASPTLFFLDEPTSGLDPGLEKKMMYDLNRLADEGRTVVLVTHATANIEQCDHVAFLSQGRMSYYGPPNEALKFFDVRDFSDIYIKMSQEVNPSKAKPIPQELQPYYKPEMGRVLAGVLWADHFRRSSQYKQFIADRQANLKEVAQAAASPEAKAKMKRPAKDSFLRQTFILTRRQFDLIRLDVRTLIIVLFMIPLLGGLFAMVSNRDDFTGMPGTPEDIERTLRLRLEGRPVDTEEKNIPTGDSQTLVTMLGLALTQGGTFAAAYEIVKERAIFRRERAVNLSVMAYVMSKVVILGGFAIFQVAAALFILGMAVDLNIPGAIFTDNGPLELYITLYLSILASILFGLFISAIVPNQDVVLYAILAQLFIQIILSGTMFPLTEPGSKKDSPVSMAVVGYWTMNAMGSTVDMEALNKESKLCKVIEVKIPSMTGGADTKEKRLECSSAAADLYLHYEHSAKHLRQMWIGLIVHSLIWFIGTIVVQSRKKID